MIQSSTVHFIHTNDLHSQFQQWPQAVETIKHLKNQCLQAGEPYLLVDIGDHTDRSHQITEGSLGKANIELMNQVGYDYVTIGNNEGITFSKEQLEQLYKEADFKVLLNNLRDQDGQIPQWCRPYEVIQAGRIRIGLIGCTANFSKFYQLLGWKIEDPLPSIYSSVEAIRDQVDMIVLLSHLGLFKDEQIAKEIDGIDLILGGHTHHVLQDGLKIEQTWISQAGRGCHFIGHVKVTFQDTEENQVVCYPRCLPVADQQENEEAKQLLKNWEDKESQQLEKKIIILPHKLENNWYEESMLGNLLAEGLRDWCETPISLVNAGQILGGLGSGEVTKRDLHRICPHPINPCIVQLTGLQLKNILQRSLDKHLQNREIKGLGFRGKLLGMMAVDGLNITYRQVDQGKEILLIENEHQIIQDQGCYDIATIDMFTFSTIFPELHQPKNAKYFLPEFLRDILAFRFEQGNIERAKLKRWKNS